MLWRAAYAAIIVAEGLTGILYLAGAISLFQAGNAPAARFNRAKTYVIAASALAFLVWFFGLMVVAGEWFAMWQSATWNGQETAFRFCVAVLAVLIFINQLDVDLPGTALDHGPGNDRGCYQPRSGSRLLREFYR